MIRKHILQILLTAAALCAAATPVSAQIYSWRDADGRLILSNKRPIDQTATARSYALPGAADIRTTRFTSADRSETFNDLILEHARRNSVRPSLVRAVIQVESAFNPLATSSKGAMGLMQLMPETAREFGVRNAYNPSENVRAGVAYLRQLLDRYADNEQLALAAYNAGPGAVDKHGQTIPPYRETRNYVGKVNEIAGHPAVAASGGTRVYRVVEMIDGRPVVKFTDRKPE